jgi:hypothetical protein
MTYEIEKVTDKKTKKPTWRPTAKQTRLTYAKLFMAYGQKYPCAELKTFEQMDQIIDDFLNKKFEI